MTYERTWFPLTGSVSRAHDIPGRRAVIAEMLALERQGVPRFTARDAVLQKYRLRYWPDKELRVPRNAPAVRQVMSLFGWPKTKAAYVRAMFRPYAPRFPLDDAIVRAIPTDLAGAVPTKMSEVLFGRPLHGAMRSIAAVEALMLTMDRETLRHERQTCTARMRGHLWIQLPTTTFARGLRRFSRKAT